MKLSRRQVDTGVANGLASENVFLLRSVVHEMESYLLILHLALPGYEVPLRGQIDMPSLADCQRRAVLFLETFQKEATDGGQAMAGCAVVRAPRQDASHSTDGEDLWDLQPE